MDYDVDRLKRFILEYLIKKGIFGGAHTPIERVIHDLPAQFLQDKRCRKKINEAIKGLVNNGWLMVRKKRTGKGDSLHISINPRSVKEVSAFLGISNSV